MHIYRRYSNEDIRKLRRTIRALVKAGTTLKELKHTLWCDRLVAISSEMDGAIRLSRSVKAFEND